MNIIGVMITTTGRDMYKCENAHPPAQEILMEEWRGAIGLELDKIDEK